MTTPSANFKRGDVVLVLFPYSSLQGAKKRPALIVQADDLSTGIPQIIVAMITSRLFRADHPSRVVISPLTAAWQGSGLLTTSVVMTDNLATVDAVVVDQTIGNLPMAEIDSALKHTLGL